MREYTKCEKCGEYRWVPTCGCIKFEIIDEEGEEYEQYALDAEAAALKHAEYANTEGDYYLMNDSVIIEVGQKKFKISAEPAINYSADEIKE